MAGNTIGQAVTFADMSAGVSSPSKLVKGALTLIEGKYDLSDIMPFISTNGQQTVKVPRPNPEAVGGVYYRNANGQYTWTRSALESFTEDTAELTYAFKLDTQEQEDSSFTIFKPSQANMDALAEQFSAELLDSMINGNPDVPVNLGTNAAPYTRLPGLIYRLKTGLNGIDTSVYTKSTVWGDPVTGIDLTITGTGPSNQLSTAINQYVMTLKPNIIISNWMLGARVMQSLRQAGGMLSVQKDQYERTLGEWNGIRWIFPSFKHSVRTVWNFADTSDWILPYEDINGVPNPTLTPTNRYGSIFFMRANSTDGFTGFNVTGMKPRGPEKLAMPDEGVGYGMRYGHGWGTLGIRCIGGIYGIKYG
jgi:hypothetical protein